MKPPRIIRKHVSREQLEWTVGYCTRHLRPLPTRLCRSYRSTFRLCKQELYKLKTMTKLPLTLLLLIFVMAGCDDTNYPFVITNVKKKKENSCKFTINYSVGFYAPCHLYQIGDTIK